MTSLGITASLLSLYTEQPIKKKSNVLQGKIRVFTSSHAFMLLTNIEGNDSTTTHAKH